MNRETHECQFLMHSQSKADYFSKVLYFYGEREREGGSCTEIGDVVQGVYTEKGCITFVR